MIDPEHTRVSEPLRWALAESQDSAMASADWLAHDIDSQYGGAVELLTDGRVKIEALQSAKGVFKTMRIVGETAADRRIGARLYVGAIAAAIVHHQKRISRQSDPALERAISSLIGDKRVPAKLRHLATTAERMLGSSNITRAESSP